MLDRLTFFPTIVMLHNFLLYFLLSVGFNQFNKLLLLIIGCLREHLGMPPWCLVLEGGLQGGWDGVSECILVMGMAIVAGGP